MRILHTSDWHLGATLNHASLLGEQEYFFDEFCQIIEEEKIDAIIIAGDVFDHAVSNAEAIALYDKTMTVLCMELKVPALVCAGNHDGAARLSSCSHLLRQAGLYVAGSIRDKEEAVVLGDTAFHLLPYFSIDEVRYLYPEVEIKTYDAAMRVLVDNIQKNHEKHNVLIAHCFVTGGQPSESDRSAMVGGANMIGADTFEEFDYVALGHLHRAQNIAKNIRYSGSPIKFSFAEANAVKSVTVIDTADFSRKEIPLCMKQDLRVLKGNYNDLVACAESDPQREDYIKVELEDEYAHIEILNTFRNFYPNLLSITGKQFKNVETTLSVEETVSLHPEDIMRMFYKEQTGEEPDERQMKWFRQALERQQKGGDAQ